MNEASRKVFYCIAGSLSSGGSQMALAGQYQLLLAQIKMMKLTILPLTRNSNTIGSTPIIL
jgi:hypothetical protein